MTRNQRFPESIGPSTSVSAIIGIGCVCRAPDRMMRVVFECVCERERKRKRGEESSARCGCVASQNRVGCALLVRAGTEKECPERRGGRDISPGARERGIRVYEL